MGNPHPPRKSLKNSMNGQRIPNWPFYGTVLAESPASEAPVTYRALNAAEVLRIGAARSVIEYQDYTAAEVVQTSHFM